MNARFGPMVLLGSALGMISSEILYSQIPRSNSIIGTTLDFLSTAPGVEVPARLKLERAYQSGLRCGPNALYVLLRLHGLAVTYDEVQKLVSVGPGGCSLSQLSKAADNLHVKTECRSEVAPDELLDPVLPAIVHLAATGEKRSEEAPVDHFTVIFGRDEDSFLGVDTAAMSVVTYDKGEIARNMTGNVLFLTKSPRTQHHLRQRLFHCVCMVGALAWVLNSVTYFRKHGFRFWHVIPR